jgi:transmembrane sensor
LEQPSTNPLGNLLGDAFEEERVPRMWRGIDRKVGHSRVRYKTGRLAATVALAVAVGCLLALGVTWLFDTSRAPSGQLALSEGTLPSVLEAKAESLSARLTDGSRIELETGSRLEVVLNDVGYMVSVLRRGRGTFDIRHGGGRRWIVRAGLARVEVVGTRFSVAVTPPTVQVSVDRGVVRVWSETLPGGNRRLTAGDSLEILGEGPFDDAATTTPPATAKLRVDLEKERARATESAVANRGWPTEPPRAPPRIGDAPVAARRADAVDIQLAAADAARRRGDKAAAVKHLERVVTEAAPRDPRRGVAALSLARLTMISRPGHAARLLEASADAMPKGLAEDALARRVEAEARAGHQEKAARLAREYFTRFPNGHRAGDVGRWATP